MIVQRYTWEDALIKAESLGLLPTGAVNMCLRLAKEINWVPKNGGPSELRWKNEDALKSVNSSRATYFRYRRVLFETGFLTERNGNLLPLVPDLSHIETVQSQVETNESHIETPESQVDTPYSEDTYTVDVLSEDTYSEDKEGPVVADAPTSPSSNYEYLGSIKDEDFPNLSLEFERLDYFSNGESVGAVANAVETDPESQIETDMPEGAVRRVDYQSKYTHNGWLYYSVAAADRARDADLISARGEDW